MQALKPKEVAEILDVSHDTVRRWALRGWLRPHVLPSGFRRYDREDVERLRRQIQKGGRTTAPSASVAPC